MRNSDTPAGAAGKRARELYEGGIRQAIEREHMGEYLVLNLETGEYVLAKDWLSASDEAEKRFADAARFMIRVGHPAAVRIGARANR